MVAVSSPPQPQARNIAAEPAQGLGSRIDYRQIYFNAVLGGIGGLFSWFLVSVQGTLFDLQALHYVVRDLLTGPVYGLCIGLAIGCSDGLVASRSLRRLMIGAAVGAALGLLGGLVGLFFGGLIFYNLGGGHWLRAIGWAIFGAFVGTSDGFAQRLPSKIRYGILGGLLGGLIGGSTYEALQQVLGRSAGLALGSAIGLVIVGACIGALVGLVESLLRQSWVFFITGRLEGQTRTVDSSRPHTLGSSASCTIVLPSDPTVAAVHAEIAWEEEQFWVRPRDGDVVVRRDGRDEPVTGRLALLPGDRIRLGDTRMIFRNEAGKQRLPR
jgi:hypothetical protein